MAKMLYFNVVFVIAILLHSSFANKCDQSGPCVCKYDDYNQINLTQLSGTTFISDGEGKYSYFFSGCKDTFFKANDYKLNSTQNFTASLIKCIETIIQVHNSTSNDTVTYIGHDCSAIGHSKDIIYDLVTENSNEYQIVYNVKKEGSSSPSITLACNNHNSTDLKISKYESDELTLYSPLVCIKHISHHELSTGSIFCIIFFTAAIIYFVGGGLIMYTARGARGIEVVPNFDFWASLPGLIKDGMIFILSGCRPFTVATAETYDRI